ncbi:NDR1/HIN1-like protein 13 [Malania oleifera]|uniref:NDR1/HIN1-like protein 13 n=1 Tax=Malania oleifera TaxID=397392 RepID=UPI0025AE1D52|nr:NDR1/HIN1-like protein 13 [Malania oleifera]
MADRVYPRGSPPSGESSTTSSQEHPVPRNPVQPSTDKPLPASGTYVIQVPKDQVYRYPPPENARRLDSYSRLKPRRNCCCRCLCCTFGVFFLLILLLAVAAGVFYLVVRPELPKYSLDNISITGFNLSATAATTDISPVIDLSVRAENPNDKISIYYEDGSSVTVLYSDMNLCDGVLPTFHQPTNNVTVFQTALRGSNILSSAVRSSMIADQKQGKVNLMVKLDAPVKIKVGAVKTWKITVRVSCDVTVDKLTAKSKILSKDCNVRVKLW